MKSLNRNTIPSAPSHPVKVLQFGGGNFLRGFADWFIDILNEKKNFNGSVEIIQSIGKNSGTTLNDQDGLYHVVTNGTQDGKPFSATRLITAVTGAFNPKDDMPRFLKAAENPDLKFIISNTTEAGITFSDRDASVSTLPETFPGKLTMLLYQRFVFFKGAPDKALIIFPCELIERNGEILKQTVLQYIAHWNLPDEFKKWITEHHHFCNTLVDRIVPGFPKDTIHDIQQQTGYEDNLVVTAEPFHLWVIEAPLSVQQVFPADQAGLHVKFVKDLTPYRTRKVRILNGAHTALMPVAYLRGLRMVRESVEDTFTGDFIRKAILEEIIPTLDSPEEELQQFANDVMERFQNPFIRHELSSIALNSISKFKVRVLPSILEFQKRKGKLPQHLVQSLAALIRFYKGEWKGEILPVNDSAEIMTFFKKAWTTNEVPAVVNQTLSNTTLWDIDLTTIPGLEKQVIENLNKLE